jgi:type IV secretion system protein TrbI
MVESPDFLATPSRGVGVRRLNRRPLIIAGVILCLILAAISYTYQMRLAELRRRNVERQGQAEPIGAEPAILKDAPGTGLIPRREPAPRQPVPPVEPLAPTPPLAPDPYAEAWARYYQELAKQQRARDQAWLQAARAPTGLKVGDRAARPAPLPVQETQLAPGQLASLYTAEALRRRFAQGDDGGEPDLNRAADKRAFLDGRAPEAASAAYLRGGRATPVSPYEIKAGTIIPATMVGGINSDLPGQILGQVAENIFDSATGGFILIPQGSKLVGSYDNSVTTGQQRVLVAWTRIILPDSSAIDLGRMPGTDQSGLAGLHDRVNTHFWEMFSSALLLSVISAGVQISQGGDTASSSGLNAQQSIAAGLGQQFGQLGQELARRNARIQPTLEIRPGYRFTVSVTKDMVLRPWVAYRKADGIGNSRTAQ